MQTYTVHEPPDTAADRLERSEQLVFVKEGFSPVAALFAPFWMVSHRLWLALVAYFAALIGIEVFVWLLGIGSSAASWIVIAGHVLIGLEADSIRRWTLARNGYRTLGSVIGRGSDECERRFFEAWLKDQPVVVPSQASSGNGGYGATGGRLNASALWPR